MHEVSDPAGFWVRLGAGILDGLLVLVVISFIISLILGIPLGSDSRLLYLLESSYYIVVPVVWTGYTIGKKALGIRIVRMDGSDLNVWHMILRFFIAGLIYGLTFGIALIVSATMVAAREDKRSLHDFIAGTYVTYNAPVENY